ncbi:MAG: single-stranded DNA-binding protein [Chitinophagaceae bacterium]
MRTNNVVLIGTIAKHLEVKKTEKGERRVAIRLRTAYRKERGLEKGTWVTQWHDVIAWGQIADFIQRNFVKGSKVLVEGSINYRTYPDQTGHLRYVTIIDAYSCMNLDR